MMSMDEQKKNKQLILHLVIAFLCFPLYYVFGEAPKILLLPYVCYMVWSQNPIYLPALLIHFTPGTTVSLFILLMCLIVSIVNLKKIKQRNLRVLFRLYLLLLPVFLYWFYINLTKNHIGFSLSLTYISFYLGLFPFFYGLLISNRVTKKIFDKIILVLFILPFLSFLPLEIGVVRAYWLSLPLFGAILLTYFSSFRKYLKGNYKLLSVFFVGVMVLISSMKFTLLMSLLLGFLIFILNLKRKYNWVSIFSGKKLILLSVLIVVLIMQNVSDYSVVTSYNQQAIRSTGMSFSDVGDFITFLKFKAFDDRAIVWVGGWAYLLDIGHYWPTGLVPEYSYTTNTGVVIDEVSYGIHNIGLELMRNYGIVIGAIITIFYLYIIGGLTKQLPEKENVFILLLASVLIGVGFIGGMVGQFVLQPTFSFIFFSLIGVIYLKKNNSA